MDEIILEKKSLDFRAQLNSWVSDTWMWARIEIEVWNDKKTLTKITRFDHTWLLLNLWELLIRFKHGNNFQKLLLVYHFIKEYITFNVSSLPSSKDRSSTETVKGAKRGLWMPYLVTRSWSFYPLPAILQRSSYYRALLVLFQDL